MFKYVTFLVLILGMLVGNTKAAGITFDQFVGNSYSSFNYDDVMPSDQRERMRNPDGSCVQCAIAMAGIHHNIPAAEFLLWNSEYGPSVRGGSTPSRVSTYCKSRNIPVYNITGNQSIEWVDWALKTGRYAAITWGRAHMILAVGISADGNIYYVCDNNSPSKIQSYSKDQFRRYFMGWSGTGWCVIINGPIPAPWKSPQYQEWWKQ